MLNNIEFNAYILNTIAFARTIVVKCEQLAFLDNKLLQQHYNIAPPADKSKWRYYLNLNGDYHATDLAMEITSLDNAETINFTKANLDLHPATKRAYRLGSYYYTRLLERYPSQLILINGIINPIPATESIPAKDYQILRYNTDYVNWNEYQLMPALQESLYSMTAMSYKTEYLYTDNLMLPLLLAKLHATLIEGILDIRQENAGTRYAHEFYIWSRLNSLGLSSIYKPVLNRKQTMWLYRNLEAHLRQLGRRVAFDQALDIILSERGIPLVRYEVIQSTEDMTDTLLPKPYMLSRPINLIDTMGLDTKLWTIEEVITKEAPLALDNPSNYNFGATDANYATQTALHTDVPSKVLESNLTDVTDRDPNRIMRVLHNEWIYLTYKGLYNINVDVTDTRNGKVTRMTTSEAVILWHYLLDRARGITRPGNIPEFEYWHVRKLVDPTWVELQQLGHKEILTEEICKAILAVHVDFPTLISPDAFFQKSKEVQDGYWNHTKLYSQVNNLFISSRRQNAVEACYESGLAKIGNFATYDDFLLKFDINLIDYTPDECLDLAWAIWSKVTGWDLNSFISIGEQQRLLINLMKDLTSYTVQYVGSTETAEGQFNLPYMMLVDGDHWLPDSETALVSDDNREFLSNHNTVKPEASLVAKEFRWSVNGEVSGRVDTHLVGHGRLYMGMTLKPIEVPPAVNNVYLPAGLTLKEATADGQSTENTLPR